MSKMINIKIVRDALLPDEDFLCRTLIRSIFMKWPSSISVGISLVPDINVIVIDKGFRGASLSIPPGAPYLWIGEVKIIADTLALSSVKAEHLEKRLSPDLTKFENLSPSRPEAFALVTDYREKLLSVSILAELTPFIQDYLQKLAGVKYG